MADYSEFIKQIAPIIRAEASKRGYTICSTVIAQAIIEGRGGLSTLAKPPYNNHFGLKCGSSWKGRSVNLKTKEEYTPGSLTTISDNFRCYDSMTDCVSGYYDFVSTKRYVNLKTAKNYIEYAEMLKADGYATASSYVTTLCSTVRQYNLDVWDLNVMATEENTYAIGKTYTLQSNMYVRQNPGGTKLKYDSLTVDGKKNGYFDEQGNAILKKGTKVTCKSLLKVSNNVWMKIPSGWVCAKSDTKVYIK